MPLFHRRGEEEKAAEAKRAEAAEQAEQEAQESLRRIEAGGLPVAAEARLRELAASEGKPGLFTSDLSVNEFTLLAGFGVQPLTQVMGSSIYNVGWQPVYYTVPTEVTVLSGAFNRCRSLAFKRLTEEAHLAAADAVVGVRILQGAHDWAARAIEFVAVGTAVRLPPHMQHPAGETVLTDLTGQEFVQLCKAGVRPVGIAAHTSVHYVPASWQTQRATTGGWGGASMVNQELRDFTQGVYDAREKAVSTVVYQAEQLGADGIVGVQIEEHARTHSVQRNMIDSEDLEVTFHVMGTAIREDPALADSHAAHKPLTVLSL
ncbi:MAG TPA: heavy metal-binding domain-containing protein [Solirubrobacteraceae bacterium]|nr:heavy metal-binding domain-containing protein [Solirubrobacteraceae bacterium]